MTENELLVNVLDTAKTFGWHSLHIRPAKTDRGWRTAVQGDGKGFPDVFLVRGERLIAAELKSAKGKVTVEQEAWLDKLATAAECFLWRPEDWTSGRIIECLR